jgi:hypothetical protein
MDPTFMHIDESALHRIVVSESSKAYLTKSVDQEEKEGYFVAYKRLCSRLASIIQKVNPDYEFPTSLVSTVLETTHTQKYFASHIPSLTEVSEGESGEVATFLSQLLFRVIQKNKS